MNRIKINALKVILAFIVLTIFYYLIIKIIKPIFPKTPDLVYLAIAVLIALAFFILIPFLIFQFRSKE